MIINTGDLTRLYLFGSARQPQAEDLIDLERYYSKNELDELELESSSLNIGNSNHILHKLNCDWDTGRGSLRNSSVMMFDAFFSSLGTKLAELCPQNLKIFLSIKTFLLALFFNHNNYADTKKTVPLNTLAGRLIRSPFHIIDALFSASGQALSKNKFFNPFALGLSIFGLVNSFISEGQSSIINPEMHYQNLPGTISRSALHQSSASLSKWLNDICHAKPLVNSLLALGSIIGFKLIPSKLTELKLSWKNLDGLLSQNIFHLSDSIFASLGTNLSQGLGKTSTGKLTIFTTLLSLIGISNIHQDSQLNKVLDKEWNFNQLDTKFYRSILHCFDALVFNLGTKIGESTNALTLILSYFAMALSVNKFLPNIAQQKISMNSCRGLLQRLPFDLIESVISSATNKVAKGLPSPIAILFGPALSFQLGELLRNEGTQFNTFGGLLNKHMIHFWDNLMSSSGYKFAQTITRFLGKAKNTEAKGSILADGKWITSDGRVVPRMALGQQL